jgi:hypothetical protein
LFVACEPSLAISAMEIVISEGEEKTS